MNEIKLVNEVIVMETAASEYVSANRSGTLQSGLVLLHEASNTNASSIPTPSRAINRELAVLIREAHGKALVTSNE